MPKYIIERNVPGAGFLTADDLKALTQRSCSVLRELGPDVQWVQSFVAEDKLYCIYIATDPDVIRKHAALGGFPVDRITEVKAIIDPAAA
ncbi:DUF4242 domain-containing protein [Methylocystis parvus]|uniref:DUF4242 domain-containing protein n=1 Tax=Methylocystis parvus TaxID=134 RepID=A0A6B8M6M0_9HYPH|nr:DUF4242 domain-containing protein [Methylocystis parvus]QGM98076.1 DUF4242 domain-containing protein [Methylocystis parvus]WBK01605.1 DUF4242 domain-containing protein [Methylocystis parvus OBBP]